MAHVLLLLLHTAGGSVVKQGQQNPSMVGTGEKAGSLRGSLLPPSAGEGTIACHRRVLHTEKMQHVDACPVGSKKFPF